ncbi:MAG: response regulator, partial [Candidatus Rokubacteria bacterium]|nr:response regulator [Candidatus Rokubacteria bacterium]
MARRVLVVEDSPTQAEQLRQLLEDGGYTVTVAANGRQALAAARQDPPTLIISDIVMPEMDGYTLCREIKSDETLKDTPVVLVTVLSSPHDIISALECGADSVIRKPYDESDLLSRLSYVQANRELRKSEKMQLGVEIDVAGRRYFIGAERRQILDLLISTYQDAIDLNAELAAGQRALERSSQFLRALYRIAKALNQATSEQAVADAALERALELPGVQAGWISLREGEAGFRLAAARGLPPALAAPGAMEGDCLCRRTLRSGEAAPAINIVECERLQRAHEETYGLRYHASIPLWVGDRTLGVMNLAGPGSGLFSDEDLRILNGVGNQVAIALERARLLEHLEDEVRGRTAALAAEVTERRQAEETQERLTTILETTSDFVAIGYADGRVAYYNRAARRMLGIGEDEDLEYIRIPDTQPDWANRIVREEGIPAAIRDGIWSGETALLSRDGREIPVSQVIIVHKAPDGSVKYLSTIARDLTERKRAEATQRQTEKLAAMGELLAGVAHELNNPLSVVLGHTALLRRAAGPGPLGARAEKIAHAAERCGRIVKNFLTLARQHPSDRQRVALNRIAQEAVELLAYPLRVDTVEVTLDLASDLPDLWADPHQLHQVVLNLVTNAHHAMRGAPPPRHLTLATRVDPARTRVSLEVSDTGPGIPLEIQPRIFEPFFTTKPPGQGTGLGLSLCQGTIEAHGGSISVESAPGRGATFRVELPIGTPPAAGQDAPTAGTSAPVPRKTILVVDDETEVADVLAEMLSADGHAVETAASGAIALEKLRARVYDLVLSDLRMPGLDGPGLYREVERRHPRLARRFVFLTGDTLSPEIT